MKIERDKIFLVAFGVVVLVVILVFAFRHKDSDLKKNPDGTFITREILKDHYDVPEKNSTGVSENIAKPESVLSAGSENEKKVRIFNIQIENDRFSPETVIVNDWDSMIIYITALDKDYDFTQPDLSINKPIPKGQTAIIRNGFGETKGAKLIFYCTSCGGPTKGPTGEIIVVPKS